MLAPLGFLGRHSLFVYLVYRPLITGLLALLGTVSLASRLRGSVEHRLCRRNAPARMRWSEELRCRAAGEKRRILTGRPGRGTERKSRSGKQSARTPAREIAGELTRKTFIEEFGGCVSATRRSSGWVQIPVATPETKNHPSQQQKSETGSNRSSAEVCGGPRPSFCRNHHPLRRRRSKTRITTSRKLQSPGFAVQHRRVRAWRNTERRDTDVRNSRLRGR